MTGPLALLVMTLLLGLLGFAYGGSEENADAGNGSGEEEATEEVVESDGSTSELPVVDNLAGGEVPPLSGTEAGEDPRTPDVIPAGGYPEAKGRGNLASWCDLQERVDEYDIQWYREQFRVNSHYKYEWEDVATFCERQLAGGFDARGILVVNSDVSDAEARAIAAADGNPQVEDLPIIRVTEIINTRGMDHESMSEFIDRRSMVRVSLLPLIEVEGEMVLDAEEGVLVECWNRWRRVPPQPPDEPGPTTTTTPGDDTTTSIPDETTTTPGDDTTTSIPDETTTTVPGPTTTTTDGKNHEDCAQTVCVTVVPPTTRVPLTTTTTTAPPPTQPATTLAPTVPDNPDCPGGHCPDHPVPTTVAPPPTVPITVSPTTVVTVPSSD